MVPFCSVGKVDSLELAKVAQARKPAHCGPLFAHHGLTPFSRTTLLKDLPFTKTQCHSPVSTAGGDSAPHCSQSPQFLLISITLWALKQSSPVLLPNNCVS